MHLAGIVFDIYDDPQGRILKTKTAGRPLPEKLASARLLDVVELDALPDRLFGLVASNDGEAVRKYAMHDAAHLTTSIIYFMETGHLLPETVRVKVAANLVNACPWYDLDPPEPLVKTALLGAVTAGLGAMNVAAKAKEGNEAKSRFMDSFRAAQASGAKVAGREVELTSEQGAAMQRGEGPEAGYITQPLSEFSELGPTEAKMKKYLGKEDQLEPTPTKTSDLTGTEVMPQGSLRGFNPRPTPQHRQATESNKTAAMRLAEEALPKSWLHSGDLSKESSPVRVKAAQAEFFAMPHLHRYPIDSVEQVKTAQAYFEEYFHELRPEERRIFSQHVSDRAEDLGMKVAGALLDYTGDTYGPYIEAELRSRINGFAGTGHEACYEVLLEKLSSTPPTVMAEMLKEADSNTGASNVYGRTGIGLRDPYAAVYGADKLAAAKPPKADTYSWSAGNDYVNGAMLQALATKGECLGKAFGEDFSKSFVKDPVGIFESMPEPHKVILSRLASDNTTGTSRI